MDNSYRIDINMYLSIYGIFWAVLLGIGPSQASAAHQGETE